MKRKPFTVTFIVLIVIALLVFGTYFVFIRPMGDNLAEQAVNLITSSIESDIPISIGSYDVTLNNQLKLNDVKIGDSENPFVVIEESFLSVGISGLIKLSKGEYTDNISLGAKGVKVNLTEELLGLFGSFDSFDSGEGVNGGILDQVKKIGVDFDISDLNLDVNLKDYHVETTSINLKLSMLSGFDVSFLELETNELSFNHEDYDIESNSLNLLYSEGDFNLSAGQLNVNNLISGKDFKISGKYPFIESNEFFLSASEASGSINNIVFDITDFETSVLLNGEFELIKGNLIKSESIDIEAFDSKFYLEDSSFEFNLLENSRIGFEATIPVLILKYGNLSANFDKFKCSIFTGLDFKDVEGKVYYDSGYFDTADICCIDSISSNESCFDFQFNSLLSFTLDSTIECKGKYQNLKSVSGNLDFKVQNFDFNKFDVSSLNPQSINAFDSLELNFENSRCNLITNEVDLNVLINKESVDLKLKVEDVINSVFSYNIDSELVESHISIQNFKPCNCASLFKKYLPELCDYYRSDSLLNLKLSSSFIISKENPLKSFDLQLNASDFCYQNNSVSLELDACGEDLKSLIEVKRLKFNGFGYSGIFSGTFDIENLIPTGLLTVDNYFTANVWYEDSHYCFEGSTDYLKDLLLRGKIKELNKECIEASVYAKYDEYEVPFDIKYSFKTNEIVLDNDTVMIEALISDEIIKLKTSVKSFYYRFSEKYKLHFSGSADVSYNLKTNDYIVSSDSFFVEAEDCFNSNFGFTFNGSELNINNLNARFEGFEGEFSGNIDYKFKSLDNITDILSNELFFSIGFREEDSLCGTYNNGDLDYELSYKINEYLNVASSGKGNINGTIKAGLCFANHVFDLVYEDKKIHFTSNDQKVGSIDLSDISFDVDIVQKTLNGSFLASRFFDRLADDVYQSGKVLFSIKLDDFSFEEITHGSVLPAGKINVSVRDVKLADGFTISDTDFDVDFGFGKATINGPLIKGSIDFKTLQFDFDVKKELLLGFKAKGVFGKEVDVMFTDLSIPIALINQFIDFPFFTAIDGTLTGNLLIIGPKDDLSFYGMLYSQVFEMALLWIPDQTLSLKSLCISVIDKNIYLAPVSVVGHSTSDGRFYSALFGVDIVLSKTGVSNMKMDLIVNEKPIDLWLPLKLSYDNLLNIRGDILGNVEFTYENKEFKVKADIDADNTEITFELPKDSPLWLSKAQETCSADVTIKTGNNVEFYYPNKDNYLINFTSEESDVVNFKFDSITGNSSGSGEFRFKSGEIYYIQNSFRITEGELYFPETPFSDSTVITPTVNLRARVREYDSNGYSNDIYLILSKATLDNITPRFESSTGLSENQIIQLLSQSVGTSERVMSASSVASIAAVATDAISKLGIINSNSNYSITSSIRESLKLNVFSIRSMILENIIVESLPGQNSNISLLARYLNGTTVFAGKYFGEDIFGKMTVLLKAMDNNTNNNSFISEDLNLDFEFSLDWENPLGAFSIFVQPNELSVVNFIDNIGFSYSKAFYF